MVMLYLLFQVGTYFLTLSFSLSRYDRIMFSTKDLNSNFQKCFRRRKIYCKSRTKLVSIYEVKRVCHSKSHDAFTIIPFSFIWSFRFRMWFSFNLSRVRYILHSLKLNQVWFMISLKNFYEKKIIMSYIILLLKFITDKSKSVNIFLFKRNYAQIYFVAVTKAELFLSQQLGKNIILHYIYIFFFYHGDGFKPKTFLFKALLPVSILLAIYTNRCHKDVNICRNEHYTEIEGTEKNIMSRK